MTSIQLKISALALFATAWLSGCSSAPTVVANGAPDFSLSAYQTFGYFDPLDTDRGDVQSLMSQHLIHVTQMELESRGLVRNDEHPQLKLNFWTAAGVSSPSSQPRVGVSVGHGSGGYYGSRTGVGISLSTLLGGPKDTQTIGIDLVDAEHEQLVFEGTYTAEISSEDSNALSAMVDRAVRDVFAQLSAQP